MSRFITEYGMPVTAVTTAQMRDVDREAVEQFQLGILQMMENAGRNLALSALDMLDGQMGDIVILAGGGGNGGGALCAGRHLHNFGCCVSVLLDRSAERLGGPAAAQLAVLRASGVDVADFEARGSLLAGAALVVDGLIGYSLTQAARGLTATLIEACNRHARLVLCNDVPSGLDATTGARPGVVVRSDCVVTLAAPKTGLRGVDNLFLADIGIPPEVFTTLGIDFVSPFAGQYLLRLIPSDG